MGNNAQANKVLAERNRQELAEIKARLLQESSRVAKAVKVAPSPPIKINTPVEEPLDKAKE